MLKIQNNFHSQKLENGFLKNKRSNFENSLKNGETVFKASNSSLNNTVNINSNSSKTIKDYNTIMQARNNNFSSKNVETQDFKRKNGGIIDLLNKSLTSNNLNQSTELIPRKIEFKLSHVLKGGEVEEIQKNLSQLKNENLNDEEKEFSAQSATVLSKFTDEPPLDFICPITQEIFVNPVIAED